VFDDYFQTDGLCADTRADRHDVTRKFANHVAAWNPGREAQRLTVRCRLGHDERYAQQMRVGVGRIDAIEDGVCCGSSC
jgi:hypothetical protein